MKKFLNLSLVLCFAFGANSLMAQEKSPAKGKEVKEAKKEEKHDKKDAKHEEKHDKKDAKHDDKKHEEKKAH